jgi:hypothetical protein
MKNIFFLFITLFFFMCLPAGAQSISDTLRTMPAAQAEPPIYWYSVIEYIPHQWHDWCGVAFSAERTNDWLWIGGLTLATFATDNATYVPAGRLYNSSPDAQNISNFLAEFGEGTSQYFFAGAFTAYGLLFEDTRALRTGIEVASVVLSSGAVVQVIKHVTGRESPYVRSSPTGVWKIFPNQIDYHRMVPYNDAFCSGHLCTTMATVITIAENYPEVQWIRPVGYTVTSLVGLGMLCNGIHWISDYPLGLFIGYYFGMVAAHPEGLPAVERSMGMKVDLLPYFSQTGSGLSMTVHF